MTELRPFQFEGIRQIYEFGGCALLADEQGLGKTVQSCAWIQKIPRHRPAVVVCPSSVKYAWQVEFNGFDLHAEVLEGRKPPRVRRLPGDIVILNYQILDSWLDVLIDSNPQCVIFDEIQYLKNPSSKRTKAAFELVQGVPSRIGLSGTPIPKELIDIWAPLAIIRPDLYPDRFKFAWHFTKPAQVFGRWIYKGARNTQELKETLMQECMIRRLKVDVAPELPDKIRKVVPLRLDTYAEYRRAKHDFIGWLKTQSPGRAYRARKSQALVRVGYLLRLVARLKMPMVIQWLKDWQEYHPGEKLVCLTMHKQVIQILRKLFPNSVVVDGEVTGRLRHEAVRKFTNNPKIQFFFGNWKAAGVGLNLQVACNLASLDFPWTPGDLLQGEDRVHRIGQKDHVVIHYLVALFTLEEKLMKILQKRADVLNLVLNEDEDTDLNIFIDLLEDIKEAA